MSFFFFLTKSFESNQFKVESGYKSVSGIELVVASIEPDTTQPSHTRLDRFFESCVEMKVRMRKNREFSLLFSTYFKMCFCKEKNRDNEWVASMGKEASECNEDESWAT